MKLVKLKLKNFLTYQSLEYDFQNRPLMIQGRNLTDEGQASNGSGKSGIQTGIEYCITASNSRGVRDNELISYGQKEATAELIASCDVRKVNIHIVWNVRLKGSNKLTITRQAYGGDWEEVSFSNVNDGKKWIMSWFAISKEDLFNYFLINKSRFKSFFESSNREKVDLINRFSDASIIEGLENIDTEELDEQYKGLERKEIEFDTKIQLKKEAIQEEQDRDLQSEYKEAIQDVDYDIEQYEKWIKNSKEEIVDYEEEIDNLKEDQDSYAPQLEQALKDVEDHNDLSDLVTRQVDEAQERVDKFVLLDKSSEKEKIQTDVDSLEGEQEEVLNRSDDYTIKRGQVLEIIEQVGVKLSGTITCPSCNHKFLLDGDIEKLEARRTQAKGLVKKLDDKIQDLNSKYKTLEEKVEELMKSSKALSQEENDSAEKKTRLQLVLSDMTRALSNHETKASRLKKEKEAIEKKIEKIGDEIGENQDEIKACEKNIKSHKESIKLLKEKKKLLKPIDNSDAISSLEKDLKELERLKGLNTKEKQKIGDLIYEKNQWKNNFKQFRLHLANQSLEVIEYHSNRYLTEMGSDLKVKLDGYRELANGSIKDEITAKIIRNVERSFSSFSGGEKGRLLFASILANRYMINKTHPYGGLDFLSIDEVFEGVDAVGLKSLIKSAKQLGIAVMIITHVTDENVTEDILLIEKVNGISNIVKS